MGKPRSAFSLIEVLVSMGVITTLVAITAAAVSPVLGKARSGKCASNLRQLGTAAMLYAAENQMSLPVTVHQKTKGGKSWTLTLQDYAGGTIVFNCPSDELKRNYTYVINDFLTPNPAGAPQLDYSRISRVDTGSKTFLFAEASATYADTDHFHFASHAGQSVPPGVFSSQVAVKRHNQAANYFFVDGHMEALTWKTVQQLLAEPESCFVEPNRKL